MDRSSDGTKETQAVLQVPDARARKGVPVQRVRVEAEAMGARAQPKSNRATGEDLVPESKNEK